MKEEIAIRLLYTLGAIFAVAAAGLLVSFAVQGRTAAQTRMGTRFGLEVLFLAGVFIPTYLGGPWLLASACILGAVCASELYGTFEDGGESPWKRSGILLGIGLILLADRVPDAIGWIFPGMLLFYWIVRWLSGADPSSGFVRLKRTLFGILYPFACLAFFVDLGLREAGFGYVVLYYGLAEVNDSAAYLVGSTVGRHKIFPKLSPKKTVEGVLGGVLLTLGLAYALWFAVTDFSAVKLGAAAMIIAAGGLAGDLFASRLKRRVGVKDYGESVPTQGGVLDVYDAFIFVAPIFYYFLRFTGMSGGG